MSALPWITEHAGGPQAILWVLVVVAAMLVVGERWRGRKIERRDES